MIIDSNDFIKYCHEQIAISKKRLTSYMTSDGRAKPGKAIAVNGTCDGIRGLELSISNMERYIKLLEDKID